MDRDSFLCINYFIYTHAEIGLFNWTPVSLMKVLSHFCERRKFVLGEFTLCGHFLSGGGTRKCAFFTSANGLFGSRVG